MARQTRIRFTKKEKELRKYLQDCFNNPDPSITIKQREKWRLELKALEDEAAYRAEEREAESQVELQAPAQQEPVPTPKPAPPDPTKLLNLELCELFSKQKWFRDRMRITDNSDLIDACEAEIRRRKLPMYFTMAGSDQHVDEEGIPVPDLKNRVYMGEIPNPNPEPNPQPMDDEYKYTPSSAQKLYWERGPWKPQQQ